MLRIYKVPIYIIRMILYTYVSSIYGKQYLPGTAWNYRSAGTTSRCIAQNTKRGVQQYSV